MQSAHCGLPVVLDDASVLAECDALAGPALARRLINRPSHDQVVDISEMLQDSVAVGVPAVDAIGKGSDRQCRSRLKPSGQARTRHNCHLSLPESAQASRNFAQNVNCLTVRLLELEARDDCDRCAAPISHKHCYPLLGPGGLWRVDAIPETMECRQATASPSITHAPTLSAPTAAAISV